MHLSPEGVQCVSMIRRLFLAALLSLFVFARPAFAQTSPPEALESRQVQAEIHAISNDRLVDGKRQVEFDATDEQGTTYHVDTAGSYTEGLRYNLKPGMQVILQVLPGEDRDLVYLSDVVRTGGLFWILVVFGVVVLLVGYLRGAMSLAGLGVTGVILFAWVFPGILAGKDPIYLTLIGGIVILAMNMHLSHGLNRRTFFSFLSTVIALLIAVVCSWVFTTIGHLSGLADEESVFLYWQAGVNPVRLIVAGFILGAVGVLDDIAVTQAETVAELHDANPELSQQELYRRAMRVGRHHIASTVNTLMLAYAGAAMPLLLLFMQSSVSPSAFVNTELVAEEIIRTLSGTVALVLAVPIATAIAAWNETRMPPGSGHTH